MLSLEKAKEILLDKLHELGLDSKKVEYIPLWEAGGRVLAEDIIAKEDVPAFDRSPVDGYAILASDTSGATESNPAVLKVIDTIAAGNYSKKMLPPGTAMRIFTGAPLPQGATSIIKQEEVTVADSQIYIKRKVNAGEGVAVKGEDISTGEFLISAGTTIQPGHVGILASLGIDFVPVYKKPEIGIFSTGSELAEIDSQLQHGQLRVSNIYTLAEIIRQAGAIPVNLGVVKDRIEDVTKVYEKAKHLNLPIVISTGGTATGDYDLIKEAMDLVSSSRLFNKVAMRPGAPVIASVKEKQLLIGLSGNPAGAAVATYMVMLPVISKMTGAKKELEKKQAKLTKPFTRNGGLRGFLWANYYEQDGCLYVTPHENQFCGAIKTFSESNCLIETTGGKINLNKEESVTIWKLPR